MTHETVMLEAVLLDYAPRVVAKNPFKDKHKRSLWRSNASSNAPDSSTSSHTAGRVQLIKRVAMPSSSVDASPPHTIYSLRFLDVHIHNDRNLPCYVLLSRSLARDLRDDSSVKQLEAHAEIVLLDAGPDGGQWRGCHLPATLEQELCVFDPLAFASIVVCKPAAAKPPSALPLVFAYGAFESYAPPQKSAEQLAREMDALSAKLLGTVMELEHETLQSDHELSLDALQRNAKQLFRMFDQDKSNSIDFDEYRQMLAYRKVHLLESKARRFFQLVDDQKKGYIDEREFVIALYITNYLRLHAAQATTTATNNPPVLSPVDVFYQLDADRDDRLNVFEYTKALELLGVATATPADVARVRRQFPLNAPNITLEQFKASWLALVDVKHELKRRNISTTTAAAGVTSTVSEQPLPFVDNVVRDAIVKRSSLTTVPETSTNSVVDSTASSNSNGSLFSPLSRLRHATKSNSTKRLVPPDALQQLLLDAIARDEQAELAVALQAKHEVIALEKARRDAEQDAKRELFNRERQTATSTRTVEALREKQEKLEHKQARVIKERQVRDERRLLAQIADETSKRQAHELLAVRAHMASKIDKLERQKAASGDDVLDLRSRQLTAIPPALYHGRDALQSLSSLLILDVSRNRLQTLPSAMFTHLFTLRALDASENDLVELPTAIGDARDLRTLNLRSNALAQLPLQLKQLRHLQVLNLSCNRLTTFGDCCDGLSALEDLDLTSNRLTTLTETIGFLTALERLVVRGNASLTLLPRNLQQLSRLVTFDLSACELKRVASDVFGPLLANLRTLTLAHNALTSIPPPIGKLAKLQELIVVRNELLQLPPSISDLRALVVLDASHNQLEALPHEIGQLLSLETLRVASNKIAALPPTLGLLSSRLQCLELQHNRLTHLPLELGALEQLQVLDVSWNELVALPEELGCLGALQRLDLSHNRLTHLPDSIVLWQRLETLQCSHNWLTTPLTPSFEALEALQYVDLSHNQLTRLEPCVYALASLEVLNIASNRLEFLPRELATACRYLKKLDVYNNSLAALPVELAALLPQLDVFAFERNPLKFLPNKWSDQWRLADQYKTSFSRGYTPAEVHEWVRDQSVCYPTIVHVWEQLAGPQAAVNTATVVGTPRPHSTDHSGSNSSRNSIDNTTLTPESLSLQATPRRAIGSDAFVSRVRAAMGGTAWQNRFERLVRHYFYEFKHVGHALVYDDVPAHERAQLAAIESERQATQQQRASVAISENNAFRAHVAQSYSVDLDSARARAIEKRKQHEHSLLVELRNETQQLNDVVVPMCKHWLAAREQRMRQERTQFAIDMKLAARERHQQRLEQRDAIQQQQRVEQRDDDAENRRTK